MGIYQLPKIKVLIVGGGCGALRYVESLIWDSSFEIVLCGTEVQGKTKCMAQNYGLPYVLFDSLTINTVSVFDCVIVALPFQVKQKYVYHLIENLSYRNAMILEKPLALDSNDLDYYKKRLGILEKCAIVCQRDFDREIYTISAADSYHITFPSNVSDEKFNKEHMLPHILSWLITEDDSLEFLEDSGNNTFSCIWKGVSCKIEFVARTEKSSLLINTTTYPNVQYRRINSEIVRNILSFGIQETENNLRKAFKVSELLMKIM